MNAFLFAAGKCLDVAATPRAHGGTLHAFTAVPFVAGLMTRLRPWQVTGRPYPALVGAAALELVGMPLLLLWLERVRVNSTATCADEIWGVGGEHDRGAVGEQTGVRNGSERS